MQNKWLPWVGVALIVVSMVVSIILEMYDPVAFAGMMLYTLMFVVSFIYVLYDSHKKEIERQRHKEKKISLSYCWNKVNNILKNMTGGDALEWAGGIGRKSEVKYFGSGENKKPYRSLYGNLAREKQIVVIVFDVEEEVIARYIANPSPDYIENPFHKFDPFNSEQGRSFMGMQGRYPYPYGRRTGKMHTNYGYPAHSANKSEYMDYESMPTSPTREEIDRAIETFEGKRNNE